MNSPAASWISELEMDNTITFLDHQQYDSFMDPFDDDDFVSMFGQSDLDPNDNYYWSPGTNSSSSSSSTLINTCNNMIPNPNIIEHPHHHTSNFLDDSSTIINPQHDDDPFIHNFINQNPWEEQNFQQVINPETLMINSEEEVIVPQVNKCSDDHQVAGKRKDQSSTTTTTSKKKGRIRPPSQTYDHIIAERRRREQLSQLFVSLSALVPGLKKMDKSSVLEDAIKYMKHLQEMVKKLEERAKQQPVGSSVIVKRSRVVFEDDGDDRDGDDEGLSSLSDDEVASDVVEEYSLPEIKARLRNGHGLIRVHCEKQRGILVKLLAKVESLNMLVVNTNVVSFGDVTLDITIVAELENGFNLTAKEVEAGLRGVLSQEAAFAGAAA